MKYILKYLLLMITPLIAEKVLNNMDIKSNLECLNEITEDETYPKKKPKDLLEIEDEKYISLIQRNSESKLLPGLTLDLAQKHIDAQEYLLAHYYVKRYLRYYHSFGHLDKAWFLGIQTLFLKLKISESQEELHKEIRRVGYDFLNTFPKSIYKKKVIHILNQTIQITYHRNNEIANYYEKIGKQKAAMFYRAKNNNNKTKVLQMSKMKVKKSNLDILNDHTFD